MDIFLEGYDVSRATWFYLSLLLIIAVFFRFNRLWSLRNLDLALLLGIAPGLLLVPDRPSAGYAYLFACTGLILLRLFVDPLFTRRPRLEQNLNAAGLAFLCVAAFGFLMTEAITAEQLPTSTVQTVDRADRLLKRQEADQTASAAAVAELDAKPGPAAPVLTAPFIELSKVVAAGNGTHSANADMFADTAARIAAIVAHFALICGLLVMGSRRFGDWQLGLAMSALYLLLPCTSYDVGRVNHVLPAALIVWAMVAYRRPLLAGSLLGLACGTLFFPVFLLPLWLAFYGRHGALRFGAALVLVAALLLGSLALTSGDTDAFIQQTYGSIDWTALQFGVETGCGFWSMVDSAYRIPVFVAFCIMVVCLTIWPRQKNLEHLIAHSTAIVVATQFWYPHQGGVYVLWYLPMMLVVVFRPRLAHQVPPGQTEMLARPQQHPERRRRELAGSAASVSRVFR